MLVSVLSVALLAIIAVAPGVAAKEGKQLDTKNNTLYLHEYEEGGAGFLSTAKSAGSESTYGYNIAGSCIGPTTLGINFEFIMDQPAFSGKAELDSSKTIDLTIRFGGDGVHVIQTEASCEFTCGDTIIAVGDPQTVSASQSMVEVTWNMKIQSASMSSSKGDPILIVNFKDLAEGGFSSGLVIDTAGGCSKMVLPVIFPSPEGENEVVPVKEILEIDENDTAEVKDVTSKEKTPGFEILSLLAAVAVAAIVSSRRR